MDNLWPERAGRAWVRDGGPAGPGLYLEKIDGHCVFLRPDNRCAVHAELGEDKKPAFCREYPFATVRTPRGTVVTVREGCGGIPETFESGTPLAEHAPAVVDLPRGYPVQQFGDKPVALLPGLGVSADDWLYLEDALQELAVKQTRQPAALVAALRARILTAVRRDPPAPDPVTALRATQALLQVYGMVLDQAMLDERGSDADRAFAEKLRAQVKRADTALPFGVPPLDASAQRYVRFLLQNHLLGKRFLRQGSVAAGLGLFIHNVHTAALAAERAPDGTVSAVSLGHTLTDHVRLTLNRSLAPMLQRARPALVDLFMSVG